MREGALQHITSVHSQQKDFKEQNTEWQKTVKNKRDDESYYNKLQEVENEQVIKEIKLREQSHQFSIAGEKVVSSSVSRGMAQKYEETL